MMFFWTILVVVSIINIPGHVDGRSYTYGRRLTRHYDDRPSYYRPSTHGRAVSGRTWPWPRDPPKPVPNTSELCEPGDLGCDQEHQELCKYHPELSWCRPTLPFVPDVGPDPPIRPPRPGPGLPTVYYRPRTHGRSVSGRMIIDPEWCKTNPELSWCPKPKPEPIIPPGPDTDFEHQELCKYHPELSWCRTPVPVIPDPDPPIPPPRPDPFGPGPWGPEPIIPPEPEPRRECEPRNIACLEACSPAGGGYWCPQPYSDEWCQIFPKQTACSRIKEGVDRCYYNPNLPECKRPPKPPVVIVIPPRPRPINPPIVEPPRPTLPEVDPDPCILRGIYMDIHVKCPEPEPVGPEPIAPEPIDELCVLNPDDPSCVPEVIEATTANPLEPIRPDGPIIYSPRGVSIVGNTDYYGGPDDRIHGSIDKHSWEKTWFK